jgi:hypothetical protein
LQNPPVPARSDAMPAARRGDEFEQMFVGNDLFLVKNGRA